jgi:hypothetical protein
MLTRDAHLGQELLVRPAALDLDLGVVVDGVRVGEDAASRDDCKQSLCHFVSCSGRL